MKKTMISRLVLGIVLCSSGGFVIAWESDRLQEQAKAMRHKASAIAENAKKEAELGNKDQAERLEKESIQILEQAEHMELKAKELGDDPERPSTDDETRRHKERTPQPHEINEAKATEKERAEARERTARGGNELHLQRVGHGRLPPELQGHAEKLEAAARRIHHMKVAAENLKMAEAHDLAHDIMQKAESMEREVREGRRRLEAEVQNRHLREQRPEHAPGVIQALKEEIEHLRAEVKELRQKVEKR